MEKEKKKGLWAIMKPVNKEIYISIILSSIASITLIVSMIVIAFTLTAIYEEKPLMLLGAELSFTNTIVLISCLVVITFVTKQYAFKISHIGSFRLEEILRTELSQHLGKLPLGFIISNGSGSLKKVILEDVQNLHAFVADSVPMFAKSYVAPAVSFIALVIIDYRLALASISVLVVGFIIMALVMRDSVELRKEYEESQSNINKAVIEFVQAMAVVRTFDDGSSSFKRYNDSLFRFRTSLKTWIDKTGTSAKMGLLILSPLPTLLVVLAYSLYLLESGSLELEHLIAAALLSTGMADAFMPIMWMSNFIKKSEAAALRIFEILDEKALEERDSGLTPKEPSVHFKNVSFNYGSEGKDALSNISFQVDPKSVVALVGPSGAGKSTVAKLIPRFWDVSEGSIEIGGVDIKELSSETLMNNVSFVFQDTFLFHDSILNNIKLANPKATLEEIVEACKAAQIHEFILTLPNGYDTKAGDRGANLSGGQKQRITIARAILRNSPILVLDEATAFADPENEEEIIKALANLMINKTVIVIAHRLSTIKDVDKIIVFDKGEISESGKHQELLEKKGLYHKLWQNYEKAQGWDLDKGAVHG